MAKYKKKPVIIEAIKFVYSQSSIEELKAFCGEALISFSKDRCPGAKGEAVIRTLEEGVNNEGRHVATEGDYIIKGIKGEVYPCKPDIFRQTYELIEE